MVEPPLGNDDDDDPGPDRKIKLAIRFLRPLPLMGPPVVGGSLPVVVVPVVDMERRWIVASAAL